MPYLVPETTKLGVFKKIMLTQTAFALLSLGAFYTVIPLLEGKSLAESYKELEYKLWPTMKANWKVWPIFHLVNFTMVPLNLQPATVAGFMVFFNIYLSFMKFVVKRPDELQEGDKQITVGGDMMSELTSHTVIN